MYRFAVLALLALTACSDSVSPRAERVFYRDDGMAAWGTVCRLDKRGFLGMGERGYVSVAHVTENGIPLIGPKDAVTVADSLSDWSFLGIDPAVLDAADYPAMRTGQAVEIHGFPARDRDGEVIPGIAYADDPVPPFWWVELHDSAEGVAAEGVIGGFSGSCVFNETGALVAVVHANGFSKIDGTTHTWAKVVPVREAILQAQGRRPGMTASAPPPAPDMQPMIVPPEPVYEHLGPLADLYPVMDAIPAYPAPSPGQPTDTGALELALLEAERVVLSSAPVPPPSPAPDRSTLPFDAPIPSDAPRYRVAVPPPAPSYRPAPPAPLPVIAGVPDRPCTACF